MSMLLLAFALTAHAGDTCPPFLEGEMTELVDAQYKVLLDGEKPNVDEHDRLSRLLETRLPCAGFEVSSDLWARYLVGVAVREYYRGGDWRKPLTTALRIAPAIDIPVRAGHPLKQFAPVSAPLPEGPLPADVALFEDGKKITLLAPLDAVHLLQRHNGDGLQTAVVTGPGEIPPEFLDHPKPTSAVRQAALNKAVHTWGTIGAGALVVAGGASLAVGLGVHEKLTDPSTPESEFPSLVAKGKPPFEVGAGLVAAGAVGGAVVWVIPW